MVLEVLPAQSGNRNTQKDIQTGKEEVWLLLFTDNLIVCMEQLKESAKKLLKLITKTGSRTFAQGVKTSLFLYTSNEQWEIKILKYIIYNSIQNVKYLGIITWPKNEKNVNNESYKTLLKEILKT